MLADRVVDISASVRRLSLRGPARVRRNKRSPRKAYAPPLEAIVHNFKSMSSPPLQTMPPPRSISSPPGGYKGGMVERARGLAEVERMAREQARHSADRRRAVPAPVREPKLMTVKTLFYMMISTTSGLDNAIINSSCTLKLRVNVFKAQNDDAKE